MTKNYLVGIGGTGARVIEAAVFMCAAGFGPANLSIFLIDPDRDNGNLTRTRKLIELYKKCLTEAEAIRKHDREFALFKTIISTPDDFVWPVLEDHNKTLGEFIDYDGMSQNWKDFVSLLFSEKELTTRLNEGFRGHPSIGSVMMAADPPDRDPWAKLWSDIETTGSTPNGILVFLIGSVFGGTGAAGVSTIGSRELIKFNRKAVLDDAEDDDKKKSKVLLGGAIVLPYFRFETKGSEQEKGIFIKPDNFLIATTAACRYYYERAERKDIGFDQVYFIGDQMDQEVGKFSAGSKNQANMPHCIEIVAALSAYDFFEQLVDKKSVDKKQYFVAGRSETKKIGWESLPFSRYATDEQPTLSISERRELFRSRVVTMTAFSYFILGYGQEIRKVEDKKENMKSTSWYWDITDKGRNLLGDNKDALNNCCEFAEQFLGWICALDDKDRVELIDRNSLVNHVEVGVGYRITDLIDYKKYPDNVGNFLKGDPKTGRNFDTFWGLLNELARELKKTKDMAPGHKFMKLFYDGASDFCGRGYYFK
jgi:hypothetical protein